MTKNFKLRLAGLALAILIVALMIGWATHASWRQFDQLRRQLTEMQIESFQTADQFRANLQELDFVLLRYTIRQDTADRDRFLKEWKKMDGWIDIQAEPATDLTREPVLTSPGDPGSARARESLDEQVLRDGEAGDESQVLVHEGEPEPAILAGGETAPEGSGQIRIMMDETHTSDQTLSASLQRWLDMSG